MSDNMAYSNSAMECSVCLDELGWNVVTRGFNEGAWWINNKEESRAVRLWEECNYLRVKENISETLELL